MLAIEGLKRKFDGMFPKKPRVIYNEAPTDNEKLLTIKDLLAFKTHVDSLTPQKRQKLTEDGAILTHIDSLWDKEVYPRMEKAKESKCGTGDFCKTYKAVGITYNDTPYLSNSVMLTQDYPWITELHHKKIIKAPKKNIHENCTLTFASTEDNPKRLLEAILETNKYKLVFIMPEIAAENKN
jgi:hypothetical protein